MEKSKLKSNAARALSFASVFLAAMLIAGCSSNNGNATVADTAPPTVSSTIPVDLDAAVSANVRCSATFSKAMGQATLSGSTFTLTSGGTAVAGAVTYADSVATFSPASILALSTQYTATITTGAKDSAGNALAEKKQWTFTTKSTPPVPQAAVSLGAAGNYVILAKTAISTVPPSVITGNTGLSPSATSFYTGFSLTNATGYATSAQVTGDMYAADMAAPTPTNLTAAIGDMGTAYTAAAGRKLPDFTELGAGQLGGLTLPPGLYKWGTDVLISNDVTLDGSPTDVWVFQIAKGVTVATGKKVILAGGALAKNIFWQSYGVVSLGSSSHLEGVVLAQTAITLGTGASVNGRLLAQTDVTLIQNTITQP